MALLTTTVISILGGMATSIIPKVVNILEKKQDHKYEIEMMELKAKYARQDTELELAKIDAQASVSQGQYVYDHDSSLSGNKFVESLRASVRPVITYFFFLAFVVIKGFILYHGIEQGHDIVELAMLLWDDDTAAIFGAILGFWFGGRIIEKTYRRKTFESM